MMNTEGSKHKIELRLVKATWTLVIVTFCIGFLAVGTTYYFMDQQVEEMKYATKLEWRPYLNIKLDSVKTAFFYTLNEGNKNDSLLIRSLSEIDVGSDSFRAIKRLVSCHACVVV